MVVDDEEELGPHRGVDLGSGTKGPTRTSVIHADSPFGLVAAEHLGLCGQRFFVQTSAPQLLADGALGHADAVAVEEDRGDLRRRAAGELQAQRRGFGEELGMARTVPVSARGRGRRASTPPLRQARIQRSMVPLRNDVRCRRDAYGDAPLWRTSAPRSGGLSRMLVASAITAQRCRAMACWWSWSMSFLPLSSCHGTGGMKRRLPTTR